MGIHAGLEICKALQPVIDSVESVTAEAGEVTIQRLDGLQTKLKDGEYCVILSPEDVSRTLKARDLRIRNERHTITLTLVASCVQQSDLNNIEPVEQFLSKLVDLDDLIYQTPIALDAPYGNVNHPIESIEVPSDDELRHLSLRIRQLQYPFTAARTGA